MVFVVNGLKNVLGKEHIDNDDNDDDDDNIEKTQQSIGLNLYPPAETYVYCARKCRGSLSPSARTR